MQRTIPELSILQAGGGAMCHTGPTLPYHTDTSGNDASALTGTKYSLAQWRAFSASTSRGDPFGCTEICNISIFKFTYHTFTLADDS